MMEVSLASSTFFHVYKKEVTLPPNVFLPSLQLAQPSTGHALIALHARIDALFNVEEERENVKKKFHQHQELIKRLFNDHFSGNKGFQVGYIVLKWDKVNHPKGKHTKFQ